MNNCILMGTIASDLNFMPLENGNKACEFLLAFAESNEKVSNIKLIAKGKAVETIKELKLSKGNQVLVEGQLIIHVNEQNEKKARLLVSTIQEVDTSTVKTTTVPTPAIPTPAIKFPPRDPLMPDRAGQEIDWDKLEEACPF